MFNKNWKDPGKERLAFFQRERQKRYETAKRETPLVVANYEKRTNERLEVRRARMRATSN